jgi:hypothetical protein
MWPGTRARKGADFDPIGGDFSQAEVMRIGSIAALGLVACQGSVGPSMDAAPSDSARTEDAQAQVDAFVPLDPLVRSTDFAEENGEVLNPDRGFYGGDRPISLVKVYLGDYCNTATLPSSVLTSARAAMSAERDAGHRAVVRMLYADDGDLNACGRADAMSLAIIEGHIAQLAPYWTEFADVIAYVQAGFLGMWGEWHSVDAPAGTALAEDANNRERVLRGLLDSVPSNRAIGVRRPRFRDELPFGAGDLARIGFHNDCFLSTATDYGTYDGDRSVEEWKDYTRGATTVVPIGGETCNDDATYTACDHAVAEMERLRFAYLNIEYSQPVIARWRNEGCFDEIERRLGYRIVVRAVEAPASVAVGGALRMRLELENVGFAPPYSTRRARIVLRNGGTERTLTPREPPDTRTWRPGTTTVDLIADLPADLDTGEWEVRLLLLEDVSDLPAYAMLFANDTRVRDDARRENLVARVTLR